MSFLCAPSLEPLWPLWFATNLAVTLALLGYSFYLTCTHDPLAAGTATKQPKDALGKGMFDLFLSSFGLIALGIVTTVPGFVATFLGAATLDFGRARLLAVLPLLLLFFGIKVAHVPERWLTPERWDFSFSPLHSHSVWHCGVWVCECLYLLVYVEALDLRAVA